MTTSTPDIARQDEELNAMLREARFVEAFERFYHDNVVMQENAAEPVLGKAANLAREQEFFGSVEEVEESTLVSSAVDGDASLSEWVVRLRFKDGTVFALNQVAARRWQDGKVVRERFYYSAS